MDISINEHNKEQINRKVKSGQYSSPDDVIKTALELLDEHDREARETHANVQRGLDQLESGECTEYTDKSLQELFDGISERGRKWLESRDAKPSS